MNFIYLLLILLFSSCSKVDNKIVIVKKNYSITEKERLATKSRFEVICKTTDAQYGIMIAKEFALIGKKRGFKYFIFVDEGDSTFLVSFYNLKSENKNAVDVDIFGK